MIYPARGLCVLGLLGGVMRWGRLGAGVFLGLCIAAGAARAAPLEAYGQLPTLDNLALSPDGTKLAYATDVNGKRTVLMSSLTEGKILAGVSTGDQKLRDLTWADNDHLLISLSVTRRAEGLMGPRREYMMTQSFSVTDKRSMPLLENVENAMNVVFDVPKRRIIDGHTVLFLEGIAFGETSGSGFLSLFTVDLDAHHTELKEHGDAGSMGWLIDANGTVYARTRYDEKKQRWSLELHRGRDWQEVFSTIAPVDTPSVLGLTPDGNSVLFQTSDNGEAVTHQLRLADGAVETPLKLDGNADSVLYDPVSKRINGTVRVGVTTSYTFFDPSDQKAWDSLARAFPGENIDLVSWSDDRRHVVVRVDGANDGAMYFFVDLTTHKAMPLGSVYRPIQPEDVAAVKVIEYKAADGTRIPAYLTLPNGKDPKNLPLIVLAHGGPAVRDTPEFDWWSQALASRGYAVLQPEFRGSDGFGWKHLSAGFGEWGRKMQTDLSDGVRFLAAAGLIDPKRVCIAGASYGGYAALAGATLDKGVYRCAVAVSGVSDPRDFLRWQARREHASDSLSLRYWTRFMGAADADDPKLAEISPQGHAAEADAPILLIHGRDDTVVPIAQSEDMETALEHAGKPVTLVKLDGEDHWLSRSETRLQMLQAMVAFLEQNNPPN